MGHQGLALFTLALVELVGPSTSLSWRVSLELSSWSKSHHYSSGVPQSCPAPV